jgi:hypothetical protein
MGLYRSPTWTANQGSTKSLLAVLPLLTIIVFLHLPVDPTSFLFSLLIKLAPLNRLSLGPMLLSRRLTFWAGDFFRAIRQ